MRFTFALSLLCLLSSAPALAKPITLNGIAFSDEQGGIVLVEGRGQGTLEDPFVLVEDIIDKGPAILTIRGLHSGFGNRILSNHDVGFSLVKIVRNRTDDSWPLFDLELRELLDNSSPYEDGLSFGQGSASGRPFQSDGYPESQEVAEPFDGVSFTGNVIPPGGTVAFRVVVTDMTPQPIFYLFQKRDKPVAEGPQGRPQLVEDRARWRGSSASGP